MRISSTITPLILAALLGAGAVAASAQDTPSQNAQATAPQASAPQSAAKGLPADLQACLQETGDYITRGNEILYVIGITNTCDTRLRCTIFASVTGAKGSSLGHTVMTLDPAGSGAGAQQTHAMRVKAAGGIAQVSRDCRVF